MTGTVRGYARVSTRDQDLTAQLRRLREEGATAIYAEKASGRNRRGRPEFERMLSDCKAGDTVLVWDISRAGRSVADLSSMITELGRKQVEFKSVMQGMIDTTSPFGKVVFHIFAAIAEMERDLTRERIREGQRVGKQAGRPSSLKAKDIKKAMRMRDEGFAYTEIARSLKVSISTIRRAIGSRRPKRKLATVRTPRQLSVSSGRVEV